MKTDNSGGTMLTRILRRYFVDAMGSMVLGLFSSLIIGLIIGQLSRITALSMLRPISEALSASSPAVGAAIGAAIAYGLKTDPLVIFSCAAAGSVGYVAGGPVGAFISSVIGSELGQLISRKTPVDILATPIVTISFGGLGGILIGPGISQFMQWIGGVVNVATELSPVPMGIAISVIVGMVLTLPISSAALCIMLGISGLAAGAATVGCCAQMIGFAVASARDNDAGGFLSQAFGTSMLQMPNIVRHPQIWIAPTLAAAVLGPVSTTILKMRNIAVGAGMGTSGLVGPITAFGEMTIDTPVFTVAAQMAVMYFIAPAVLTLVFDGIMRRAGMVKNGQMKLKQF